MHLGHSHHLILVNQDWRAHTAHTREVQALEQLLKTCVPQTQLNLLHDRLQFCKGIKMWCFSKRSAEEEKHAAGKQALRRESNCIILHTGQHPSRGHWALIYNTAIVLSTKHCKTWELHRCSSAQTPKCPHLTNKSSDTVLPAGVESDWRDTSVPPQGIFKATLEATYLWRTEAVKPYP